MQKKKQRISLMERLRRGALGWMLRKEEIHRTREYRRWENGWKRNGLLNGKPLTSSAIRRIGSKENAIKLGIITK